LSTALAVRRDLTFTGRQGAQDEGEIYLTSGSATEGFANNRYPVVQLLVTEAFTYWLAMALTFRRGRDLRMTSASMIIFEGVAIDSTKTPLLRAEWHEWNSPSPHAQPHWHVYPSALANSARVVTEIFSEEPIVHEFGIESRHHALPAIAEFHYAMSAKWHVSGGSCQERLVTTQALLDWFRGCISYMRGQLSYLST
jgi:hypothetical protein